MARFSERMGIRKPKDTIQIGTVDDELRRRLWNLMSERCWRHADEFAAFQVMHRDSFERMWIDFFNSPVDEVREARSWRDLRKILYSFLMECPWEEVYDFIEYVADRWDFNTPSARKEFRRACNSVLEANLAGYRIVGAVIAPIASDDQAAAIKNALSTAEASKPLHPIGIHLNQALVLLANRKAPDFRNSMKESISAVEALCKLIAGDDKATLGQALKAIEKKRLVPMHPQLQAAFQSLYNYSNDADGIRHALKDEPDVALEDATFMLVTCSAFVNYMVEKARKAGIAL